MENRQVEQYSPPQVPIGGLLHKDVLFHNFNHPISKCNRLHFKHQRIPNLMPTAVLPWLNQITCPAKLLNYRTVSVLLRDFVRCVLTGLLSLGQHVVLVTGSDLMRREGLSLGAEARLTDRR